MPSGSSAREIESLVGPHAEHPLATTQQNVAWENESLRVECNLVRNVTTLEDRMAVRIMPAAEPYYSAMVVPRSADGRLHLVGRYRYPVNRWSLEFPRFDLQDGDDGWKEGAARDLARIAGLNSEQMTLLGAVQIEPALLSTTAVIILAEGCRRTSSSAGVAAGNDCGTGEMDASETFAEALTATVAELSELILRGGITCGVTLAALSLYLAAPR